MEPISTTALIGVGWFASKALGPSAEELGDQLKVYVGDKIRAIVSKAEKKADPSKVEALSPAFFYNFSQKAAFSEDSDQITEMWASLLSSAAEGQTYRHAIYADILSRIGASEAKFISKMCSGIDLLNSPGLKEQELRKYLFDKVTEKFSEYEMQDEELAKKNLEELFRFKFGWPVSSKSAMWPCRVDGKSSMIRTSIVMSSDGDPFAVDVLCRERLLDFFEFDFSPGWSSPLLEGYMLTHLGANFVLACQRKDLQK